jgi:ATP/maltotriose-dependent transcriptional regulator MalT
VLLDGLSLLTTDGQAAATPTLQRAAVALADMSVEDVLRWGWMAQSASVTVWDDEGWRAISDRQVQLLRDAGALAELPIQLSALGMAQAGMGDFVGAAELAAEADSVAAATGSMFAPFTLLRLLGLQGRESEAAPTIRQAATGPPGVAIFAHWAAAVLYNGLCRYEVAVSSAREATSNPFDHLVSVRALPELVEAAVRTGDVAGAREAMHSLAEATQPSGTDLAIGIEARSRALLCDGAEADGLFRTAIDRLSLTRNRPELARAHLLYGEWLRRKRQPTVARDHLHAAHDMASVMGMEAFAERARRELVATGEKVSKQTRENRGSLTPQEGQIARLARDGLSNPEIGAQLFVSARTVEWHLRNVFGKLGITSRRQLRTVLTEDDHRG